MKKMHGLLALGAAALLVAGCGSSNNDGPAAPVTPVPPVVTTDVPSSATANSAGLVTFVNSQIGLSSETGEPILVGDAVLPTDDTTETSL